MKTTETSSKWAAWGSNVMIRVKTKKKVIVMVNPTGDDGLEAVGDVVSTGKLVRNAEDLICQHVRFNANMVIHIFGNLDEDEEVFILVPEVAIQAMLVSEIQTQ